MWVEILNASGTLWYILITQMEGLIFITNKTQYKNGIYY